MYWIGMCWNILAGYDLIDALAPSALASDSSLFYPLWCLMMDENQNWWQLTSIDDPRWSVLDDNLIDVVWCSGLFGSKESDGPKMDQTGCFNPIFWTSGSFLELGTSQDPINPKAIGFIFNRRKCSSQKEAERGSMFYHFSLESDSRIFRHTHISSLLVIYSIVKTGHQQQSWRPC